MIYILRSLWERISKKKHLDRAFILIFYYNNNCSKQTFTGCSLWSRNCLKTNVLRICIFISISQQPHEVATLASRFTAEEAVAHEGQGTWGKLQSYECQREDLNPANLAPQCVLWTVSPFCLLRELWSTKVLNAKSVFVGACIESHDFLYISLFSTQRLFETCLNHRHERAWNVVICVSKLR